MPCSGAVAALCAWPGRVVGWLLLPLMVIVLVTVAAASLGWNEFLRLGRGSARARAGADGQLPAGSAVVHLRDGGTVRHGLRASARIATCWLDFLLGGLTPRRDDGWCSSSVT
ncbi:MAG: hypothetical protein U5L11_07860 [Arhodomonas sp.]|nr:hypothetical protein [Arhodomonas sp.]